MLRKREQATELVVVTMRLPDDIIEAVRALADAASKRAGVGSVTRSDVYRNCLRIGIEKMQEQENQG